MSLDDSDTQERLRKVVVPPDLTISLAVPILDSAGLGILLLCADGRRLVGVLTDGNIRRALLKKVNFNKPVSAIATLDPLVAQPDVSPSEALHIMDAGRSFAVNHLPVVEAGGRLVGLLLRRDLINEERLGLSAVIMAGGFGRRLAPLTRDLPKPMLPVGDRPLMHHIVERLRDAGIRRMNVTTHYQHDKIAEYFGDGSEFGVELNYVPEDEPLGTAGALGLMNVPDETLLVVNGDVLTNFDVRAMLAFHREHGAELTVAVRGHEIEVPYGVLDCDGPNVRRLKEKPRINLLINGGAYLLEPEVYRFIPGGRRYDMTDLIQRLVTEKRRVVGFPIREYWLDIGHHDEYARAQADIAEGKLVS